MKTQICTVGDVGVRRPKLRPDGPLGPYTDFTFFNSRLE